MKLVLPFPPSVNTYWRAPNKGPLKAAILSARRVGHTRARHVQRSLSNCVAYQNHHHHQLRWRSFFPPDARRRDIDNYNKALFDAFTHAGIWEDDSRAENVGGVGPKVRGGRVEISITVHQPTMGNWVRAILTPEIAPISGVVLFRPYRTALVIPSGKGSY